MLAVVDGVYESVFEFVITAEKFWFDEVNHGKVLVEVVLEGCRSGRLLNSVLLFFTIEDQCKKCVFCKHISHLMVPLQCDTPDSVLVSLKFWKQQTRRV